jgi:hypothetical protein
VVDRLALTGVQWVDAVWHLLSHQPPTRRVCLLLLLHHSWVDVAGVLLPLHTAGVLRAIFIHFCEMFIYARPSVSLFWLFHLLRWSGKGSGVIGAYYFQLCAKGPIA